ncbi:MAG: hypothetical protein H6707_04830 [Deltaproteobacteria bacterium]|nr:hypothetical protein [Deltaproteobacteria bacterium]
MEPNLFESFFRSDDATRVLDAHRAACRASAGALQAADPQALWQPRIFGPTEALRCRCGRLIGEANRDERCDRCGVECAQPELRSQRWAHLDLPIPLAPPALRTHLAAALAVDPEQLVSRLGATEDAWPLSPTLDKLRRSSAAAGLITQLPVSPPETRKFQREERFLPDECRYLAHPIGSAYQEFIRQTSRLSRLLELDAPPIILSNEVINWYQQFETLQQAFREETPRIGNLWRVPSPPPSPRNNSVVLLSAPSPAEWVDLSDEASSPTGMAFIDDHRLVLTLRYNGVIVDRRDGSATPLASCAGVCIGSVDGAALLIDYPTCEQAGQLHGVYLYDVADSSWRKMLPEAHCAVFVEKDQPEDAWLIDGRRGLRSAALLEDISGDRCDEVCRSPDGRFIWTGSSSEDGVVYDATDALPVLIVSRYRDQLVPARRNGHTAEEISKLALPASLPAARPPSWWEGENDGDPFDELNASDLLPGVAIARDSAGRWLLFDSASDFSIDGQRQFHVAALVQTAAFDDELQKLALYTRQCVLIVDLATVSVEQLIDLRPLCTHLGAIDIDDDDEQIDQTLNELLYRYGNLEAAQRISIEELCSDTLESSEAAAFKARKLTPWPRHLPIRRDMR